MPYEKDPNELGALWVKTGAKGEYMTGTVEINGAKVNIVCFRNDRASGNQPQWRVLKSVPKGEKSASRAELDAAGVPF